MLPIHPPVLDYIHPVPSEEMPAAMQQLFLQLLIVPAIRLQSQLSPTALKQHSAGAAAVPKGLSWVLDPPLPLPGVSISLPQRGVAHRFLHMCAVTFLRGTLALSPDSYLALRRDLLHYELECCHLDRAPWVSTQSSQGMQAAAES